MRFKGYSSFFSSDIFTGAEVAFNFIYSAPGNEAVVYCISSAGSVILSYCVSIAGSVLTLPYNFSRFGLVLWAYNFSFYCDEIVIFIYSCVGVALLSSSLCSFRITPLSGADVIEPRF